jgi:hypothetical protein
MPPSRAFLWLWPARHHAANTWTGAARPTAALDVDAAQALPVSHGAKAAHELVAGTPLGHLAPLLAAEALVALAYVLAGPTAIRLFELQALTLGILLNTLTGRPAPALVAYEGC